MGFVCAGLLLALLTFVPAAPATAAGPDIILPHRAGYELTLKSAKSGSGIIDVSGVLSYDWADSCDGWAVEQRYILRIIRGSGPPLQISASYANWESKDGLRYRFYVKRAREPEGEEEEREVQGEATLKETGAAGSAEFDQPRREKVKLPAGTVFPTAHTIALISKAESGEKFDRRLVFDGDEVGGPSLLTAFILPQRAAPPGGKPKSLVDPQPVWPMSIAVFAQDDKTGTPEFEMTIYLQPNGVVPELTMDYGDFTVAGRLKVFEALKKGTC